MPDPNNIIMPEHGLGFILNPKCANSSVKEACLKALGIQTTRIHANHEGVEYVSTADMKRYYPALTRVALVRNPFDRLVSFYADKICMRWKEKFARAGFKFQMPFDDFVQVVINTPHNKAEQHFRPLYRETNVRGKCVAERLIRFESLLLDWKNIQEISKKPLPDLGHKTKSERGTWQTYYTPETLHAVRRYYIKDFKQFGYDTTAIEGVK